MASTVKDSMKPGARMTIQIGVRRRRISLGVLARFWYDSRSPQGAWREGPESILARGRDVVGEGPI
jgi:hypothetical protein